MSSSPDCLQTESLKILNARLGRPHASELPEGHPLFGKTCDQMSALAVSNVCIELPVVERGWAPQRLFHRSPRKTWSGTPVASGTRGSTPCVPTRQT